MGWVGHPAHMAPKGCHYRSRFMFFSFGRSSTRLRLVPGSNGHPYGVPICAPLRGAHYKSRSFNARVRVCARTQPEGLGHMSQFWPKLSRSRRKFAGTFFFHFPGSFGPSLLKNSSLFGFFLNSGFLAQIKTCQN